jgi:hypothetical protein
MANIVIRQGLKWFKIVVINLLLLAILTELVSLGYYFVRTGRLFYLTKDGGIDVASGFVVSQARVERNIIERLHPYFGFTTKPGTTYKLSFSQAEHKANNYGFTTSYAYPFEGRDPQYIVGIFGGSVAQNYAVYEQEHGILAQSLKQLPALRDKEIVVLPFAYGGYKQPQQLLVLNYFMSLGQHFDMVINIDGFNEVALSELNTKAGMEIAMPSIEHILPLINLASGDESTEELASRLRIEQYKERLTMENQTLGRCTLASCYVLHLLYVRHLDACYRKEVNRYDQFWARKFNGTGDTGQDSLVQINRDSSLIPDTPEVFERMVSIWAESSRIMEQELADGGVPYFQVIQPNQYNPTGRVFGDDEKRVAIQEDSRYASSVRSGYPILLSKVSGLRKTGVKVIDATEVFDQRKEAVYADTCCHYNQLGSEIFANFVAASIVETIMKNHT